MSHLCANTVQMQVSTQLTIALGLTGAIAFGFHGMYQLNAERRDLRNTVAKEVILLGKSLQVALENALRDQKLEDIQETLERLEAVEPHVDIIVAAPDGDVRAFSQGAKISDAQIKALLLTMAVDTPAQVHWLPAPEPLDIVFSTPLHEDDGRWQGTLLVSRPLTDMRADLAATERSIAFTAGLFVVLAALVGALLGRFVVRRPLARVMAGMRDLRQRESAEALPHAGSSEIDDLAQEFNALVADLQTARGRLRQEAESRQQLELGLRRIDKLVSIGQLSAGLAHEIGSPLQILIGRASALSNKADDPDKVRHHAQVLVREAERIARIVERLLQFARRRPALMAAVDLAATARFVGELLSPEARRRRIRVDFSTVTGHEIVRGDAEQLQQVLMNLISNAMAATAAGGRVQVAVTSVVMEYGQTSMPAVRLTVSDTGHGMTPETLQKIFEPFFTTRADEGGTGLGLAVVKAIIDEHHGTIAVQSEQGLGTHVTVELPTPSTTAEVTSSP